jgi:2-methylcitrate dehydratase PrpD
VQRLANFVVGLKYDDLPVPVVEAVKLHVLDSLGCALAAHALGVASAAESVVGVEAGSGLSTAIGEERRMPATSAALVNGTLMHALDYDGTHGLSRVHVSAPVIPAALACAEENALGGRSTILAVVCGFETTLRIGAPVGLRLLQRGFHPTSWCGAFGAAAASAKLRGLGADDIVSSFGIAGSLSSGLMEPVVSGSTTKPLHAGWAAHAGIFASAWAQAGVTGTSSVIEGTYGFYATAAGGAPDDVSACDFDGKTTWETLRVAFKPYPACHIFHAHLDALRAVLAEHQLSPSDVMEIVASIPEELIPFVLEPAVDKRVPRTGYDAKFSLQYSLAAMLVHGDVTLATYSDDAIVDSKVLAAAAHVTYEPFRFVSFPEFFPGAVRVVTADGRNLAAQVPFERGSLANPMTADDVATKFAANARLALADGDATRVAGLVSSLEAVDPDGIRELGSLLAGARRA